MQYRLKTGEKVISFQAERKSDHVIVLAHDDCHLDIEYSLISGHHQHLVINGKPLNAYLARDGDATAVIIRGIPYSIKDADIPGTRARGKKGLQAIPQEVTPPMPAVVVRILVAKGDIVKQGQGVIVVESMKMETTLSAPYDGIVGAVNVAKGDKVMPGQILVDIDRDDAVSDKEISQPG
jgi:biotin carboxyl carrier protein